MERLEKKKEGRVTLEVADGKGEGPCRASGERYPGRDRLERGRGTPTAMTEGE